MRSVAVALVALAASPLHAAEPLDASAALAERMRALQGQPGGLTSDQVARRSEETSPDVRSHAAEVVAAAAQVDQALALAFPRLSLSGRYQRLSSIAQPSLGPGAIVVVPTAPSDPMQPLPAGAPLFATSFTFPVVLDNYVGQASLQVPISDYVLRVVQGLSAAAHSREASKLTERATRLKVASDGRLLYYNWVRARGGALVAEESLATAEGHLADLRKMFDAGIVSKADVLRVDSQVASTELLVERSRNFAQVLERQLRVTMHESSGPSYAIGEDLLTVLPPMRLAESDDALTDEALTKRLEVRAITESVGSLRDQSKLARAGYFPRLDAYGDLIYANPSPRIFPQEEKFRATWDVGAQLSWSPNDAGGAVAQRRGADARVVQVQAQKQQLTDGLRVEIAAARGALREAEVAVATSARGLAAAEESYRVRRELFRQGKATSVELTDAEVDLARARLEAINARIDQRSARVRINHALGRDTP